MNESIIHTEYCITSRHSHNFILFVNATKDIAIVVDTLVILNYINMKRKLLDKT